MAELAFIGVGDVGGIPHSAASDGMAQDEAAAMRPLLIGLSAWAWALIGLLPGFAGTSAVLLLERYYLDAEADLWRSQIAKRSVYQVERQLQATGLLPRVMRSTNFFADEISQDSFESINDNLRPRQVLPSLVALAFARRQAGNTVDPRPHYAYERVPPLAGNTL